MLIHSKYQPSLLEAHLALLEEEMITEHHESFEIVCKFLPTVSTWHYHHTGWQIERVDGKYYRLVKDAVTLESIPPSPQPVLQTAQDYGCLLWVLSYAALIFQGEGEFHQRFSLADLSAFLRQWSSSQTGKVELNFDERKSDRLSLYRVLKYLTRQGYLNSTHRALETWVDQAQGTAILSFTDATLLLLRAFRSRFASIGVKSAFTDSPEVLFPSHLWTLSPPSPFVRVWRTLLLGSCLLRGDDPEAFQVLCSDIAIFEQEAAITFGYELELDSNYATLVRPHGLPLHRHPIFHSPSITDHILLLLCQQLRTEIGAQAILPDEFGYISLSFLDLVDLFLRYIRPLYEQFWGRAALNKSAEDHIEAVCNRMRGLGLLRGPDPLGRFIILPLAARFGAHYVGESPFPGDGT